MQYVKMKQLSEKIWKELQITRDAGQKEYAQNDDNVFANFERVAKKIGNPASRPDIQKEDPVFSKITRERVLLVYLLKHIDGICAHVDGHESQREDVRGRIKDAMVYLMLLWGMIEEQHEI
tara:strand:+ start:125 stop:487 length:363 start_codon:yes stop_codon:yes gene_type:complete